MLFDRRRGVSLCLVCGRDKCSPIGRRMRFGRPQEKKHGQPQQEAGIILKYWISTSKFEHRVKRDVLAPVRLL